MNFGCYNQHCLNRFLNEIGSGDRLLLLILYEIRRYQTDKGTPYWRRFLPLWCASVSHDSTAQSCYRMRFSKYPSFRFEFMLQSLLLASIPPTFLLRTSAHHELSSFLRLKALSISSALNAIPMHAATVPLWAR